MGRKDKGKPTESDAPPGPKGAPTPPPVFLVYVSEGPGSWLIGEDFVGLTPGLNIRTADEWSGADQNKIVSKLLADKQIVVSDEALSGYDSPAARLELAETSNDPKAVAWMHKAEVARPVTAGPHARRRGAIVDILARKLKRIASTG